MKSLFVSVLLVCSAFTGSLLAQEFEVPNDYVLNVAEDYVKYEKEIIAAANWLVSVPLNEQASKRKEVSAFVVAWISGSPTVNVELNETILDFEKKNTGMMVIYMASCAKYVLENNYSKELRAKHKAALGDMIKVYKSGKGIKKDKKMLKLIESADNGNIDGWIGENLKVNQ